MAVDDEEWVYIDGDQGTTASAVPAPAVVVCSSEGLVEPALDLELLAGLDYLTRKKAFRIRMDVPHDTTEVVATADVVGDGEVDDANAAEDEDDCSSYSSEGRLEKGYETDEGLDQVADESEHEHPGTSDVKLRGLLDNLKYIEGTLLDCQRQVLDCRKSIEDHRKATRDEAAPAPPPSPAPLAHHYESLHAAAYASLYRGRVYSGKSSGYGYGYGTSSGYGYGGGGYDGGLSDYDYGGGRGGYNRGISGYDYGGLGYYYRPGISNIKYGYGGGGGYSIGSGYRFGGDEGYGGISAYGNRYGRDGGYYSDFDYGGLGDRYNGSLGVALEPGVGMYPAQPGSRYGCTIPSSTMPKEPTVKPEALS